MMNVDFIVQQLFFLANTDKASFFKNFFKTGNGQYAEGDIFLGIPVPLIRDIVKKKLKMSLDEIQILIRSPYHEVRLAGLLFLVKQFKKTKNEKEQRDIFNFYLNNTCSINNWDLVDITCRDVVGLYLLDKKKKREILYKLAESHSLWEQRIAIVSTWTFIKYGQFDDTLALAEKFLDDNTHDLIQKAIGWMLREIGKKNKTILIIFLEKYHQRMPRVELRYAIEHFSLKERMYFMK